MKLLTAFRHRKAVEPFVEFVETLSGRGHEVTVGVHERDPKVATLFADPGAFPLVTLPDRRRDAWFEVTELGRNARDVAQYLSASYRPATKLRGRVVERLLKSVAVPNDVCRRWSPDSLLDLGEDAGRHLRRVLARLEDLTPPDEPSLRLIERLAPEALLVTPLLHFGSNQVEIVKAAKALGVPVGMVLFSWDNLSTKGALHVLPDHLFVWNARQRREAAELHGFDPQRVSVTGAPRFDRFFRLRSKVDDHEFRTGLGVPPGTPIVLYVCSSRLVSGKEVNFIRQWAAAIRQAPHAALRDALLVIRPHPDVPIAEGTWLSGERTFRWPGFAAEPRVRTLFGDPRTVVLTSDYDAAQMLFECIHHSAAVVGLNTSAEIEAGIVGRPVFTILSDTAYADGQHTTLHFHYLTRDNGGFVHVSPTLDDHVSALAGRLAAPGSANEWQEAVIDFVRPGGRDRAASEVLADAVEEAFARGPAARASRAEEVPVRVAITDSLRAQPALPLVAWLETRIAPSTVVYDLTARTGEFCVEVARRLHCTVVAFESNLAALSVLWQRVVAAQCNGLVVPLLMKPGARGGLGQDRFASAAADAPRLSSRPVAWREHDLPPNGEIIQPVLSVPIDWAIERWKLPPPAVVRLELSNTGDDLLDAVTRLAADPRVTLVVASGAAVARAHLPGRLEAVGYAALEIDPAYDTLVWGRASSRTAERAVLPQARLQ